ncbi:oligopeptide ABC transporter (permease) [Ruminococcaceae bacterium BL-6]|nr:oligopeptide ABC transporter (permease) [Ruminococcaceae bacterium BL-6]
MPKRGFIMKKFILKRILISIITLFVLITVVFFLVRLMPGGPFMDPKMTPTIKARMEAYYGLDKPVIQQYFIYLGNLLKGNYGYSMRYTNRSVNDILAASFPFSADVGIRALVIALFFGLTLGITAALHRGKSPDFVCIFIAIVGTSIPDFILGGLLQYFFGIKWRLLPVAQYLSFQYTILPSIALGLGLMASISRVMRSSMLEVVGQDYIKTAKAKGVSQFRITAKHEIRNAIIPIITIMGPSVAAILTGTFVIESIFAIPGMGKYYVESINANDYTMILGMTVFYGAFLILANLVVDILYGVADPRIRVGRKEAA